MELQTQPLRERIFSILNNNDSPSFAIRPSLSQRSSTTDPRRSIASPPYSPQKGGRPSLLRHPKYDRESSYSSSDSPPALSRLSSSSSKVSTSSMDSSPSPATPAYNYLDSSLLQYDPLLRQDALVGGYLPSPTTLTPFLDQQLLIAPSMADQMLAKSMIPLPPTQYPIIPAPLHPALQSLAVPLQPINAPVPPPVTSAPTSVQSMTSPTMSSAPPTGKKNKYPCPYAQSHNCQATFTTSGHAARHGKKHTGEKGVHCPVCNKAFTRKDNMKQHERTHKGQSTSSSTSDESTRRSKAAVTKDAQKAKLKKEHSGTTEVSQRSSILQSPLSEVTSIAPTAVDTPLDMEDLATYVGPPQVLMPLQAIPDTLSPNSLYPPLSGEEFLMTAPPIDQVPIMSKAVDPSLDISGLMNPMPPFTRGFSDLDTLAQAAESFDTTLYPNGMYPDLIQAP